MKVAKKVTKDVYFYEFPHTTGASSATEETLELPKSMMSIVQADALIPPCQEITFSEFVVPQGFFGEPDVLIVVEIL